MAAGSKYDNRQRREAVAQYLLLGNVEAVATATHIPASTLRDWMTSTWWGMLSVEVRAEKGAELDGAYTRVIDAAICQLLDRVEHGDHVMVGGRTQRRPMSGRDLALVSGIILDKQTMLRNQSAPATTVDLSIDELARGLRNYAQEKDRMEGYDPRGR